MAKKKVISAINRVKKTFNSKGEDITKKFTLEGFQDRFNKLFVIRLNDPEGNFTLQTISVHQKGDKAVKRLKAIAQALNEKCYNDNSVVKVKYSKF